MAYRVLLKRKWVNTFGKSYPIGTILQTNSQLGSELIRLKFGDKYDGDYPPKEKVKMNLNNLNE